ncbi:MAG: ABC transporter permease subunit [Anaerolineae bacterium]
MSELAWTARSAIVLAHKEFRDALRNRWFWLFSGAFTLLAVGVSWLGLAGIGGTGVAGFGRTAASLINLVLLFVPMMGLVLGALSLAGERESGAMLYLLAQPVTIYDLLAGKLLGLGAAVTGVIAIGFAMSGLVVAWHGAAQVKPFAAIAGLTVALALISLSLGLCISAAPRRSATAVGFGLFVWLTLAFLGDLGIMGTAIAFRLDAGMLLTLVLLNPLQVCKIAAVMALQGGLDVLGPAGLLALRLYGDRLWALLGLVLFAWWAIPITVAAMLLRWRGGL